jgi:hypothetical protein
MLIFRYLEIIRALIRVSSMVELGCCDPSNDVDLVIWPFGSPLIGQIQTHRNMFDTLNTNSPHCICTVTDTHMIHVDISGAS